MSDVKVLVGLQNETIYTSPLQISDNTNVQNYVDNEYSTLDFRLRGISRIKVREFREDEISYNEIWILQYRQSVHKIYKINPYLNYKNEQILEISDQNFLCLDFYLVKQQLILDCSDQIEQKIIFFQLNLKTNQTSQHYFNYYYSLYTARKIYFHEILIIILIKDVDNQIVSIFERQTQREIKSFNNMDFKLSELKVKKIIIKNDRMLILTQCQKLFVVDLKEPFIIQQICIDQLIHEIQDNFDQGFLVFENQNIYFLTNLLFCVKTGQYLKETLLILFEQSGLFKFNPKDQQIGRLMSCCESNVTYFSYIDQMIFCKSPNQIKQIIFTDQQFSKVKITNNFYQASDQTLITRIIKPGEIEYIDIQEDFISLIYVQEEQNIIIKYNPLFHGPNITYTFKSKEFVQTFNQFIIQYEQEDQQCYFYDFYSISDYFKNYAYFCQFENKTVQMSVAKIDLTQQNKIIQYNYQLYFYLNESFLILSADSQTLRLMQLDTQQTYEFNQLNQLQVRHSITFLYFNPLYLQQFNDTILQFRSQNELKLQFNFTLDNIKSLGIDQKVNFRYLSTDKQYLFLGTENYVIVFYIATFHQDNMKLQLVQIFENKLQIGQVYLSFEILYLIYSDNGYLKILKYQKLQFLYFQYVGEVDCLGQKVEKFNLNRNQAAKYYFINSYQDILIFQLSNSLQNSLIRIIPNSRFIRSLDNNFCTSEKTKIICYGIYEDRSQIQLNFELIKHSKSIPYQVCASNSNNMKCINQNLRVVINYQSLKINNYYLTHIHQDVYQINFDIEQGFINSIKGDDNVEIIQPMKVISNQTRNIVQISEYENHIMINSNKGISFYHKKSKQFFQLNDMCFQAFLLQNHLMCYQASYSFVKIYNCEDIQNCILLDQISINNRVLMQVKYSGNLILLKQNQSMEIVYYNPASSKFMRRITLIEKSQYEIIRQIKPYDFWFIYLNNQNLQILKYLNFEQQLNQTIKIYEEFNKDNQFTSKQDNIIEILVLEYNYNQITLLLLMKQSTHKAYTFSLVNNVVDIQCIFELLFYRQKNSQDKYKFSLNNDLLLIQIEQTLGVYNVSLNQQVFLRNILFVLQPNFILSITLIRNIHHFIEQNQIYLFISQTSELHIFELNLNYQIKILDVKKQSIMKLNEDKENIQIIISQNDDTNQFYNHKILIILAVILIIVYIIRRQIKKRNT